MNIKRSNTLLAHKFLLTILFPLCFSSSLYAAGQVPDAGRLLREQPKVPPTLPGSPLQRIAPQTEEQPVADTGAKVLVKGFRIEGATLIPADELQSQIQRAIGRELSFTELRAVSEALVAYYAQRGYLAQAVLPPQDVDDGIVLIKIIEGKRGSILINNTGKRASSERIQGFIDYRLAQGDPMSLEGLGEAVNLLNEQPGIEVKSTLKPGAAEGETGLVINVKEKPLANFTLGMSNKGSRGTGILQGIASAKLNNPLGLFDEASVLLTKSDGSIFGLGSYSLAVGDSGLRLGGSASRMVYKVTQESLAATEAHGTATTVGLNTSYPLYRYTNFSLSLTGNLDAKYLRDATVAGETSDHTVNTATFGINGKRTDGFAGGGETTFDLGLVYGHADDDNAGAVTTDQTTRQALGNFGKLKFDLGRQQVITDTWLLQANLRGQMAYDNLDSSERFSLGGADGIRAFPSGEGGGDDGWLLSLNLVHSFSDAIQGTLFLDTGGIRINHTTWANWNSGNPSLDNHYQLTGIGAALDWKINDYLAVTATVSTRLGGNPGHDANGQDADSTHRDVRGWINLVGEF